MRKIVCDNSDFLLLASNFCCDHDFSIIWPSLAEESLRVDAWTDMCSAWDDGDLHRCLMWTVQGVDFWAQLDFCYGSCWYLSVGVGFLKRSVVLAQQLFYLEPDYVRKFSVRVLDVEDRDGLDG